jgi:hypothetical protein
MAQWKETLEPYVKVIESVKTAPLNPTAGEDLIIGAVIISDAGPATPTLVTSQSEFLSNYAAEDLTEDYVKSLDDLYTSDPGSSLASTMWLNAYRLSGSANLLICRASKASGLVYSKPLKKSSLDEYVLKDTEVLRKVSGKFKIVIDNEGEGSTDGWAIAVTDTGIIGNRVDDSGPLYDYYVDNLPDLVDKLNETTKFFSPSYTFYSDIKCENEIVDIEGNESQAVAVLFDEVYLGTSVLDTDELTSGLSYLIVATPEWEDLSDTQHLINLNASQYSGFEEVQYYASNLYNAKTDLKVRIRRFNHNAVQQKVLSDSETANGTSPWIVVPSVLDVYTKGGTITPAKSVLEYDFYEFAILDPAVSSDWQLFNVGNISGRGDISAADLNDSLSMIYLSLPDNLLNLGLNYYGYTADNGVWEAYTGESEEYAKLVSSKDLLPDEASEGEIYAVGTEDSHNLYQYTGTGVEEINANLKIDPTESSLLDVSDSDIMSAWDKIEDDERYVVEGITDLGNTYTIIQNYMANMAVASNYFYPISTVNSTNYMTIANKASKIVKDSSKLYLLSPWDLDDGTVGFLFNASPATIYWEAVCKNRLNNNEFAGVFGQNTGIVSVVNPAKDFKKTERQLLLTKKVNTIFHDLYLEKYYINDNYTKQSDDNIMSEECNSRLQIRISKAMPLLLNQFKGRQANARTWADAKDVVDYWFKTTLLPMNYTIADYNIICDETNNPAEIQRANKMVMRVQIRFYNSVKYITVYEDAYPVGVEFSSEG